MANAESKSGSPGPEPDRLKIDGDWEEAFGQAASKPIPPEGLPEPPNRNPKGGRKKKATGKKPKAKRN